MKHCFKFGLISLAVASAFGMSGLVRSVRDVVPKGTDLKKTAYTIPAYDSSTHKKSDVQTVYADSSEKTTSSGQPTSMNSYQWQKANGTSNTSVSMGFPISTLYSLAGGYDYVALGVPITHFGGTDGAVDGIVGFDWYWDTSNTRPGFDTRINSGVTSLVTSTFTSQFNSITYKYLAFSVQALKNCNPSLVDSASAQDTNSAIVNFGFRDTFPNDSVYTSPVFSYFGYGNPDAIHSGGSKTIGVLCDIAPTDGNDIIKQVSAQDLFGVACDVTCSNVADYKPKLGSYTLNLSATDTYGQTATATLIVNVYDNVKPVIKQVTGKVLSFGVDQDTLKFADLASYFTITDNGTAYGGTIGTPTYTLDGKALTADHPFIASEFGDHVLAVTVADSSSNSQTTEFTLHAVDHVMPVISRIDGANVGGALTVGLSKTFSLTASDFLTMYQAVDNVSGNVHSSMTADISAIKSKVGTYTVRITADDGNGNVAHADVPVTVKADIPPVFILGSSLVVTTTSNALSLSQLQNTVVNGILGASTVTSVSVDASSYIGHETEVGDYNIDYSATYEDDVKGLVRKEARQTVNGTFVLRVTKAGASAETTKLSFWDQIRLFFQRLGNWFRAVFTKFKFNVWLTNDEWDAEYGSKEQTSASDSAVSVSSAEVSVISE